MLNPPPPDQREIERKKRSVATLSVISNSTLVIAKLAVGIFIGSVAVVSEAVHSGVDLIASFIALAAVRYAHAPADERHPYGYGKVENVSGVAEALLIFLGAGWIMFESLHKLMQPEPIESPFLGIVVMAVSAAANLAVSSKLFKIAQETDSVALRADAWHLRTDVYTSAGVMAGLGVITVGKNLWPTVSLSWVDPVAALAVATLIVKAAWDLTAEAGRDLLDARLATDDEQIVHDLLAATPAVRGYHALLTRKAGPRRFVEFHMVLDGHMSVVDSHDVAMDVSRKIESRLSGSRVVTHVEPCLGRCPPRCLAGCLLTPERRAQVQAENGVVPDAEGALPLSSSSAPPSSDAAKSPEGGSLS